MYQGAASVLTWAMDDVSTGRADTTRTRGWDESTEELLRDRHRRATAARAGHYHLAGRSRRRNLFLGVPAVVFSTVVGTSLFATLTKQTINSTLRLVIGLVSVIAAILTALQTFLRFGERADKHVVAGDWYSAVRRDIDEILALPPHLRERPKECLDKLRKEMSKIGQQAPEIDDRLWTTLRRRYDVDDAPRRRSEPKAATEAAGRAGSTA